MGITKLSDRFMSAALINSSRIVYEKFKLFEIVSNLSQFLSDL